MSTDIRGQLQSLSIPTDRRPISPATQGGSRSIAGWIVLLIFLGGGGYLAYVNKDRILAAVQGATSSKPEVRVITVTARPESERPPIIIATGKIVSDHQVEVATKVSGQVVELHFEQGDRVEQGQLLSRIEAVNYRARRDEAAAWLERAKATLDYERVNFERMKNLSEQNSAQKIELADALRTLNEAEAQVGALKAALEFAEKALKDCEVTAPISGVVLERNVEVGDFVAAEGGRGAMANAQFAAIADMTKLRVEVDISELDIARIRKDMYCVVTPDAYKDRKYPGHVMWLDPGANYSKATVQAKVRIGNPDDYLRVDGSAQVAFYEEQPSSDESKPPAIWIPPTACKTDGSPSPPHATVFLVKEGQLHERTVSLGRRQGAEVEVTAGLTSGDRIVADNVAGLMNGQRVME